MLQKLRPIGPQIEVAAKKMIRTNPFHEERIARPLEGESEPKGALAPIAARVLMKILFAAHMARYDLLRAVQGLLDGSLLLIVEVSV